MKRAKTILFAGLVLLLTACHETYDHVSDAHDGMSGGTIGLYVFIMLFCFGFLAGGIPLLVFGIRRLKKKPSYKGGPITRVTFGGIFIFIGATAMILTTCSFFNPAFAIPESNKYKTVEKVLEKATDESVTHFRCSRKGYNRNEYLHDEGYVIRDSLKGLTFKSIKQKDRELSHGAHLEYYVDLEPQNNATYPFSEIRIYEDGYCYVDYVKAYQHKTASFFYEIESNTAKAIVSLAERKNDEQRNRAYQQEMELRERGKIENFFAKSKEISEAQASVTFASRSYNFKFKKEGFDIISDFRYAEMKDNIYADEIPLNIYIGSWGFHLCKNNEKGYFIRLVYSPEGRSFNYYYSVRDIDAEAMLDVAREEFKEQNPQLFDLSAYYEAGKIEGYFVSRDYGDFNLTEISHNAHNYTITFKRDDLANIKGMTYTLLEEAPSNEQPVVLTIKNLQCPWVYKLHADFENKKDYYVELLFTFKDILDEEHTFTYYYTLSDEDGQNIFKVAEDQFKTERPELFYPEYEDGKIENFFQEVVKEDNEHSSFRYHTIWYTLNIKKEDLVTISNYTYTQNYDVLRSKGTVLRIYNYTPFWEFALQRLNVNEESYFVSLKYTFKGADDKNVDINYYYRISNADATAMYNFFLAKCAEQHPEAFAE